MLAGWLLKKLFQKIFLGWVDRILGACLALIKGVVLSYFIIVLATFFVPLKSPLITQSRLAPVIIRSYQTMVGFIPSDSHEKLKKSYDKQKKKLQEVFDEKNTGA